MNNRKYTLNTNIFNNIDNEAKAYWLGFFLGDGSIVKDTALKLELSNIDFNHIEKCQLFMGSTAPISQTKKDCSYISFNSKDLVTNVMKYGLVRNKTYKNILTPQLDKELIVHFYRGILEADGWITEHKNNKCFCTQYEFGFSSYNYYFLKEIQDWIITKLGNKCGYLVERFRANRTQRVCQLIIGGNKNYQKLYQLFYKDATVYLDRKYQKSTEFYDLVTNHVDRRGKHPRIKKISS